MKQPILKTYTEPNLDYIRENAKDVILIKSKILDEILLTVENKTYNNYMNISDKQLAELGEKYLILDKEVEEFFTQIGYLGQLMNLRQSDEITDLYNFLIPIFSERELEKSLDRRYYEAILEVKQNGGMTKDEELSIDRAIREEKRNGIDLSDELKVSLNQIEEELSLLSTQFNINNTNALDAINIEIKKTDFKSLDEREIDSFKNDNGTYSVKNFNDYIKYMTYSNNREQKQVLYKTFNTLALDNEEVIVKTLELRQKMMDILGYSTFSDYILEERDAKEKINVQNMLISLKKYSLEPAKKEIADLEKYAKDKDNIDELKPYDLAYYENLYIKEFFDIDENYIKEYFELTHTLDEVLKFISNSFQSKFVEATDKYKTWHKDVKVYEVLENEKISGVIYFDLIERNKKSPGAWKSGLENYHVDGNKDINLPVCLVSTNFSQPNEEGISLLKHNDLVTLLHEMGHATHHLFSKVELNSLSGTNVLWDVVEYPSQFLEYFAYDKDTLTKISSHYKTGQNLDTDNIDKIINAKNFLSAYRTIRQTQLASTDFNLHSDNETKDIKDIYNMTQKTLEEFQLLPISDFQKQHINSFSHIFAGGYASGYYSYKWAEIFSAGTYRFLSTSKRKDEDLLKYKKNILEKGGTINMTEAFKEMTGKNLDIKDLMIVEGII